MEVEVKVKVGKVRAFLYRLAERFRIRVYSRITSKAGDEILRHISRKAPRSRVPKRLHLADSFFKQVRARDKVVITTRVPYASYVEYGTRPSPGRYVPYICRTGEPPTRSPWSNPNVPGRRYTRRVAHRKDYGQHPGVAPRYFVRRSVEQAQNRIREIARLEITNAIRGRA